MNKSGLEFERRRAGLGIVAVLLKMTSRPKGV
jgi:hypothetical protein